MSVITTERAAMRALFLLLAVAVLSLTGCGGDLRTHPVAKSTSAIPRLTTSLEDPIAAVERELTEADFSRPSPDSSPWQKGTKNGGIIVILSPENGVSATAQYNRTDGSATCKIPGPGIVLVSRIEDLDAIPTATKLITEHNCKPA